MDEVSVDGVVIFRVSVNHHVHETALAGVFELSVQVDVFAGAPHAAGDDGSHLVGVERVAVDAQGVAVDARETGGVDVPVGAVGCFVTDGVVEQHAVVELHLAWRGYGCEERDGRQVVALVEAEGGVVVLVDAGVGDDVGELGLKGGVELAVVVSRASRKSQERCY